jgi:pSer/pThr/pTyr-binding forkhead associated (FHA) protein
MIKCPVCQAEYPENTLFCGECASYLHRGDQEGTDPLATAEVVVPWPRREKTKVPEEEVVSPVSLKLSIPDSGREVELPLSREVNMGRLDPATACFPEIDLTSDGGLEKGVSRRHAKISRRGSKIFIQDLGSINGTFLNRKKLTPYLPQALRSGDELQLSKLMLRVSLQ